MAVYNKYGVRIDEGGGGSGADYSFLVGKKYFALGDSIVYNSGTKANPVTVSGQQLYGYTQAIEDRYGVVCTNKGQSGHTIIQDYTTLYNTDYSEATLVTIGYGVNDGRLNVPLGTRDSVDTTTFAGALNRLIQKIYTDNKDCRILILTPIQRLLVNSWGSYTQNSNGNTLEDFAEMCKSVANYNGTMCADLFHNSGINAINLSSLTVEGVHPLNKGYVRMSDIILPQTDTLFAGTANTAQDLIDGNEVEY